MAMLILSDDEFTKELLSLSVTIPSNSVQKLSSIVHSESPTEKSETENKNSEKENIEKSHTNTLSESYKVVDIERGRGHVPAVPQGIRQLIAQEAIEGATAKELSEVFDVSPSSISAYKNSATSTATYHKPDPNLQRANARVIANITFKARGRMLAAIEQITDARLASAKLQTISSVARDMSSVIRNLEPTTSSVQNNQILVYKPRLKEEEEFEVIEAVDLDESF